VGCLGVPAAVASCGREGGGCVESGLWCGPLCSHVMWMNCISFSRFGLFFFYKLLASLHNVKGPF